MLVAVLDQQPIVVLVGVAALQTHEHPRAFELFSVNAELEVAFGKRLLGGEIAFNLPVTPVPEHDGAAAILAFRDRTFEVAVVEWVVFDINGQALVGGVERGPARHRPGLEHAVEFEAEVVVEAGGCVLLNDEARAFRFRDVRGT